MGSAALQAALAEHRQGKRYGIGKAAGSEPAAFRRSVGKRGKFGAQKTMVDGITFASGWESRCYEDLRALQLGGSIADLQLQVPFPVEINGCIVFVYIADFVFRDLAQGGVWRVIDAKGKVLADFQLKARAVSALYGVAVECWFDPNEKKREPLVYDMLTAEPARKRPRTGKRSVAPEWATERRLALAAGMEPTAPDSGQESAPAPKGRRPRQRGAGA